MFSSAQILLRLLAFLALLASSSKFVTPVPVKLETEPERYNSAGERFAMAGAVGAASGIKNAGPIVGAFCFPHGTITFDPQTRNFSGIPAVKPDSKEKCIKLHEAMQAQADMLISTRPDLILLSTPHGVRVQDSWLFLSNKLAKGHAEWDGDWTNYTGQFEIDTSISKLFFDQLRQRNNPVERLGVGTEDDVLPLRWAEVVPWYFITEAAKRANFTLPPAIFVAHPFKRDDGTQRLIPELIKLGNDMASIMAQDEQLSDRRIAVVVSSDLSHYHSSDPTSPYPYEPNSSVFDTFIEDWANTDYNVFTLDAATDRLARKAGDLVDSIRSCGYTGLVLLHGILQHFVQNGALFKSNMLEYSAPTYYGMMVNYWVPLP